MNIVINNKTYEVELIDGVTSKDIVEKLPLELKLNRYAEHEYSGELPFTPKMDKNTTSNVVVGHLYYWDGWNSFVINYKDLDISPYKVVDLGDIKDKSIVEILENADRSINVRLENNNEK